MPLSKNDKTKMAEWETTNALVEFQILCARKFTLIISLVQLLLCRYVYKQHIVHSSFMSQVYFQWCLLLPVIYFYIITYENIYSL